MLSLDDISERLFIRSQEAVLQLELWIRRQQQLNEFGYGDQGDKLADQYNLYMAQLNSLCVRTEYIRDKLSGSYQQDRASVSNVQNYIEDLVYEFQDITVKLNELAQRQREQETPSSKHSGESSDSFQPRPLKITERHEAKIIATRQSPTKVAGKFKNVNFIEESIPGMSCDFRCTSLPGSPVRAASSPAKLLRVAKSYDTGLNHNAKTRRKKQKDDEVLSIFKEKQRLSITFCNDIEEESDSASDQNTVISTSPISSSFPTHHDEKDEKLPLRRCNSHDSILSKKIRSLSPVKCPTFLLFPGANRPSMKSVQVSSAPIISSIEGKASSKDMLSSFISHTSNHDGKKQSNDNSDNKGFRSGLLWNLFRLQNERQNEKARDSVLPETSVHETLFERKGDIFQMANPPRGVYSSCSRLLVKNRQSSIISPTLQNFNDGDAVYDELQEALNTELIL